MKLQHKTQYIHAVWVVFFYRVWIYPVRFKVMDATTVIHRGTRCVLHLLHSAGFCLPLHADLQDLTLRSPTVSTKAAMVNRLPSFLRRFWTALSGAVALQTHTRHSSIGHALLETRLVRQPEHNWSAISGALFSSLHAYSFHGRRIELWKTRNEMQQKHQELG